MYRYLSLFTLLLLILDARENPFFPTDNSSELMTSNIIKTDEPLKQASVKLPSTARTVESITISYKNIDGTIKEKTIDVQNSIDWHLPLFISQNYQQNGVVKHKKSVKKEKSNFHTLAKLPFIKFSIDKNKIYLETKDQLLRKFLLVNPHRIVCDFKRETDIRSYVKKIKKENLSLIKVGTHKGYYRVVLELDGAYRYSTQKNSRGYIFTLK
jgi:hypothetical protein